MKLANVIKQVLEYLKSSDMKEQDAFMIISVISKFLKKNVIIVDDEDFKAVKDYLYVKKSREKKGKELMPIRVIEDVPQFIYSSTLLGIDKEFVLINGAYEKGEIVSLPKPVAEYLVRCGYAEEIYIDNDLFNYADKEDTQQDK